MDTGDVEIFISYATLNDERDSGVVQWVQEQLQGELLVQSGVVCDVFLDRKDLQWGQRWESVLNERINSSMDMLAVLSPSYFESSHCHDEYLTLKKERRVLVRQI